MPRTKLTKALQDEIPRMRMQEMGRIGLSVSSGIITEEIRRELVFPECIKTFKRMAYDSTISSALTLYDLLFSVSSWKVRAPLGATAEQKTRAKFIESCMKDMDHSWREFVQEAGSMVPYGFAVHEKVYRRRLKVNGSRYDDGLIGWKKLAPRSQDTLDKWIFSEDGRDLLAVRQNLNYTEQDGRFSMTEREVTIPRKKFMLIRIGKKRDNPTGESLLKGAFIPWKFRTAIEETEAIGIQRDLSGLPVVHIPPQYMAEDATQEQKAIYEYYKRMVQNIQTNQQGGVVMPSAFDPDTKQPLFKFELMGSEGRKNFDTDKIITRYDNKILTALGADILIMGQSATGSYNLGTIKQALVNMSIEARLQEIADVVNNDLIPQTFALNGWTDEEYPEVYFDDFTEENLEEFSKMVQRVASVGMIERDRPVLNKIRRSFGVDVLPDDLAPQQDLLTPATSKAGAAMGTPFEGGRTSAGTGNDNDGNLDNTA